MLMLGTFKCLTAPMCVKSDNIKVHDIIKVEREKMNTVLKVEKEEKDASKEE